MDLTRVDTIVQFTSGSATVWNDVTKPVPMGAVVIDTINQIVKEGDGTTLFANLPVCLDYNFSGGVSGAVHPIGTDVGTIAVSQNSMYSPSTVKLTDILTSIASLNAAAIAQQAAIDSVTSSSIVASVTPGTIDGTIVICSGGKYTVGNQTLAQLIANLIAESSTVGVSMHLTDLVFYTDSGLTQPVLTPNDLNDSTTYWCKVTGWHDGIVISNISFTLSTTQSGITITSSPVTTPLNLITATYSSSGTDQFNKVVIDSTGSIICVGNTDASGAATALICKFDAFLNPIVRKTFTGNYSSTFTSVVVDASNNLICVGNLTTVSGGLGEALIVKFDTTLANILLQKSYGGSDDDGFRDVAIDPAGNYIAVGYTSSEGLGSYDCLIVKFSSIDLSILARQHYGGTLEDELHAVAIDPSGNAICVGYTYSEGPNISGLILKLNSNLTIVARKTYNSTLGVLTKFFGVAINSSNVIYAVGHVGVTANQLLVVRFDSSLNVTANNLYANTLGSGRISAVVIDSSGNVYCGGMTTMEGAGAGDIIILKLTSNLSIISQKTYGTINTDRSLGLALTSTGDIICAGFIFTNGTTDAVVAKMPGSLPTGLYSNKYFTDLILTDAYLPFNNDTATVNTSTLTLAASTLTLATSTMSFGPANGAVVSDTTIMNAVPNTFQVSIAGGVAQGGTIVPTFVATANDGNVVTSKSMSVNVHPLNILECLYGGGTNDSFNAVAVDSSGNIYCAGYTQSEGSGNSDALVIKFDTNLNILARKIYGGANDEVFQSIAIDSSNNIICAGYTTTEGTPGYPHCLVVKFDINFTILARKIYGGAYYDYFLGVAVDSSGNIYCAGYTQSESVAGGNPQYQDALIVKFDSTLNILARKIYGANSFHDGFYAVAVDVSGNIICAGYSGVDSTGNNGYAFVIKFDTNLSILVKNVYGGTGNTWFRGVAIDSSNNIICAGYTTGEGVGLQDALVIKFDTNLNILARKIYGGSNNELFYSVAVDSFDNIICVGYTYSEGSGFPAYQDALIVKFNSSLNVVFKKRYGGTNSDLLISVAVDSSNNIICSGATSSSGSGNYDGVILKLPSSISSGSFTGTVLTGLTLADSNLTLSNSNLTLYAAGYTSANSALTLNNSALTLNNSTLTRRFDTIYA